MAIDSEVKALIKGGLEEGESELYGMNSVFKPSLQADVEASRGKPVVWWCPHAVWGQRSRREQMQCPVIGHLKGQGLDV